MTRGQTAPIGAPCWVDLMTSDPARSREFYTQLLGWTAEEPNEEFGGYFNFRTDDLRVAGCMAADADAPVRDVWAVYLCTDDATKTLEAASTNGAQVVVDAMPVGDLGTMGFVIDPSGAGVGLWQPRTFAGFGVVYEPGAPGWFELHTRDYDAAVRFYRDAFGWDARPMSDSDDFRYTVLQHGDTQLAGILDAASFLPEGMPSYWTVYFAVPDTDDAVARLQELGGSVLQPAEDTPYGRIAVVTDSTGAMFRLVSGTPGQE